MCMEAINDSYLQIPQQDYSIIARPLVSCLVQDQTGECTVRAGPPAVVWGCTQSQDQCPSCGVVVH